MNLVTLDDSELIQRLQALEADGLTRFSLLDGTLRGAIVSTSTLTAQAAANHKLGLLETLAWGQAAAGALLMTVMLKDERAIALRMDCSGPLRGFSVEADLSGSVRGYLFNEGIVLDRPLDSFDLKPFIQEGTLTVVRSRPDGKNYSGHIALKYGRIAEDITEYWLQSEQIRTACRLSVFFDKQGRIAGAGGIFLQAMPGANDVDLEDAEVRLMELDSPGVYFSTGKGRKDLLNEWFGAFKPVPLTEQAVSFFCPCSRERYADFLSRLEGSELQKMIDEGPHPAELLCHNCGSRYLYTKEELQALRR